MKLYIIDKILISFIILSSFISCNNIDLNNKQIENVLNYIGTPDSSSDRSSLVFSDKGAWFGYGFPDTSAYFGGFSGPFIMTQENGTWSSQALSKLNLRFKDSTKSIDWNGFNHTSSGFNSHLEQVFENDKMLISQYLFFTSPHTALINSRIKNISNITIDLVPAWIGTLFNKSLHFNKTDGLIRIKSDKSNAIGYIYVHDGVNVLKEFSDSTYTVSLKEFKLQPGETKELLLSQSFIFSNSNWEFEFDRISNSDIKYSEMLQNRVLEKEEEIDIVYNRISSRLNTSITKKVVTKSILTLQNNWRVPAGELKHSGLFPSYHYIWFHGFWAWDSWKHSSALSLYNSELAKEQIFAMYDFQTEEGFIADCVYRDTTIENHNFRNTKPPLSAWAVLNVFENDQDYGFLENIYEKMVKQHNWWYKFRDNDKDSLCEYGSTDGSLIAAKWESGMDNAVRFDSSQVLKNSKNAYSLNQESVDLNSYLYAEKKYLSIIANELDKEDDALVYRTGASKLKAKIQSQFYDPYTGWFYDTSIDGRKFVKAMGCEGWIPLWASAASPEQAEEVKKNIMNTKYFNTKIPLQTLSAADPKYEPDGGYWRGPNWLDQAYFGVKGLRNYGYEIEADSLLHKIILNADGLINKGPSIRENYNPITGQGLESENFSWSAAHIILLLIED